MSSRPSDKALAPTTPRLPGGGYSEEELVRGLQAVALFAGNTHRAARHLKACGHPIPRSTLRQWVTSTRVEEYERARVVVRDRVWEQMAEEHQQVAQEALHATRKAMSRAEERLAEDDVKGANSAASAARNLATVAGITNDKAAAAHGRPTEIKHQGPDFEATVAGLRRLGLVIEDEPIDAVVVPDTAPAPPS